MNKILYLAMFSASLVAVLGSQAAFAGAPFVGEDNTFWASCTISSGESGVCDFSVGPSAFNLTPNFIPNWFCTQDECQIGTPNFIDPLQLKQFHITTDNAEVDSIECFDAPPDFDDLNDVKSFGSRDSKVPNGAFGFIEEWRCEPNPDFEVIFLSFTGDPISNVDIHTVSKTDPPPPPPVVGGELIPIESTSLLLAGAQSTSWLIPVVLSIVGIGLVFLRRK